MNPLAIIITIDRSWQSCFTCLFYRI